MGLLLYVIFTGGEEKETSHSAYLQFLVLENLEKLPVQINVEIIHEIDSPLFSVLDAFLSAYMLVCIDSS